MSRLSFPQHRKLMTTALVLLTTAIWPTLSWSTIALPGHGKSMPELLVMLSDGDTHLRFSAALELGSRHDSAAVPALQAALSDSEAGIRITAASSLIQLDDRSGLLVLKAALDCDDAYWALSAAHALATAGDSSGKGLITANLTSTSWIFRSKALKALDALPGGAPIHAISAALADESRHVRRDAFSIAANKRPSEIRALLIQYTQSPDPDTREQAVSALSRADPSGSMQVLLQMLTDSNRKVRDTTLYWLEHLAGRKVSTQGASSLGSARVTQREWRLWWAENKQTPLPGTTVPFHSEHRKIPFSSLQLSPTAGVSGVDVSKSSK